MSDKELEDKIKHQVKMELDLNNLLLNHGDLKKDIYGIKKLLEQQNKENRADHKKYDIDLVQLIDKVEIIEKRDVIDIIVLTIRNHPKTSIIVISLALLRNPISLIIENLIQILL